MKAPCGSRSCVSVCTFVPVKQVKVKREPVARAARFYPPAEAAGALFRPANAPASSPPVVKSVVKWLQVGGGGDTCSACSSAYPG